MVKNPKNLFLNKTELFEEKYLLDNSAIAFHIWRE